jgi:hypothetical protein
LSARGDVSALADLAGVFTGQPASRPLTLNRSGEGGGRMLLTSRHALPSALLGDTAKYPPFGMVARSWVILA